MRNRLMVNTGAQPQKDNLKNLRREEYCINYGCDYMNLNIRQDCTKFYPHRHSHTQMSNMEQISQGKCIL